VVQQPQRVAFLDASRRVEAGGVDGAGTIVKRSRATPRRSTTSPAKLSQPISSASAPSSTRSIASRWVSQQEPTQWPSPPWIETTVGTPISRAASSTAQPLG
jgi:hypothetical protein